jgi:hypothetical protein
LCCIPVILNRADFDPFEQQSPPAKDACAPLSPGRPKGLKSHGCEDYREARHEESDGGKGGKVTDKIGHLSLLTCYVPILFSFCFHVNSFFGLAYCQRDATQSGSLVPHQVDQRINKTPPGGPDGVDGDKGT